MSSKFHLQLAHEYWAKLVQPGDTVVDATTGNGHDAAILASLALKESRGKLYLFDIQPQALTSTLERLKSYPPGSIIACNQCHAEIAKILQPSSCKLIVFNLGYLPGGNKSLTTQTNTTLQALSNALNCLCLGGAVSMTCYPGHPEGKREEAEVLSLCEKLDPKMWQVCSHRVINRTNYPHLVLINRL